MDRLQNCCMESKPVWAICKAITNKQDWYSKVFDDEIVNKWREEIKQEDLDAFSMCIGFLRATAKGVVHRDDCTWDDDSFCDKCTEKFKAMMRDATKRDEFYNDYGFDPDDEFDVQEIEEYYEWQSENCNHALCECIPPVFDLHSYIDYKNKGMQKNRIKYDEE